MLDDKVINLRLNSFAAFADATAMCSFLHNLTGNEYTVSSDDILGFTVGMIESDHQPEVEHRQEALFYRQALRGFIPHYLEIAVGTMLAFSPDTALGWIFYMLKIRTIPDWLHLSLWSNLFTFAGYALLLYGLRFIYSYYATSLCFEADSVILKKGIIARDQVQIRYGDIKTTNIKQSVLDRLLGIGTLNLDSAGTNGTVDIEFHNLVNPVHMRQRVQRLMGRC